MHVVVIEPVRLPSKILMTHRSIANPPSVSFSHPDPLAPAVTGN